MEPTAKKWLIWGGVAIAALVLLWLVFRSSGSNSPGVQDVGVGGITFGNSASSLAALGAFGGGVPGVKINPGTVATGADTGSSVTSTTGAGSTSKKTPAPATHPVTSKPATIFIGASGPGVYMAPASTAPAQNPLTKHLQP